MSFQLCASLEGEDVVFRIDQDYFLAGTVDPNDYLNDSYINDEGND